MTRLPTLADFDFDGLQALEWTIRAPNGYPSIEQAVASLTAFLAPETVAQTISNVFPVVRGSNRRNFDDPTNPTVMWDDNDGPHIAFRAASGGIRVLRQHLNLNHIYGAGAVELFTNLRNLCVTPSFLAALTDRHDGIVSMLKRRAFVLYGFAPQGEPPAENYDDLIWAPPLTPVTDLEHVLRAALRRRNGHIAQSVRRLGWCFNGFAGDPF